MLEKVCMAARYSSRQPVTLKQADGSAHFSTLKLTVSIRVAVYYAVLLK